MTNYKSLMQEAIKKLAVIKKGTTFRLTDLVDNPPACLGKIFHQEVVLGKISNVIFVGFDNQSDIYSKA